jgi:transcriptional regulator with XRE-family HTH domain
MKMELATEKLILKEEKSAYDTNIDNNLSHFQNFKEILKEDKSMNILNFIKFENYYCQITPLFQNFLKSKVSNYSEIARKLNVSSTTISRILQIDNYWMNFKTLINLSRLLRISKKELIMHIRHIKTKNSFPIRFNIKSLFSPAFFRITGHILGDGGFHIIKNEGKYKAFYTNNQQRLLDSFFNDIKSVFGNIKIYSRKRKRHRNEIWLPTTIGYLLYEILEYEKNQDKRIPMFVLNTNDSKLLGPFLQSLYDDDGYLYPQKNMIVISQKRKELLKDIRKVVKNIGVRPNQVLIHKAKNRTLMYYFSITGKENILSFYKKVNFIHPLKKRKLQILVNKYGGM